MAEHAGAGKRRRERRLRAHLRYARMSVAMVLAESNHHAAPRGQDMARDRVEGHEEKHNAPRRPSALTPGRKNSQRAWRNKKPVLTLSAVTDKEGRPLENEDDSGRRLCEYWRTHFPST